MAKIFIADIEAGRDIATKFMVVEKQLRTARNGSPFLTLKLVDKTGEITGRVWEQAEEIAADIAVKSAVAVKGRSEKYRDELQLQIQEISPLPAEQIDPADFLPMCPIRSETLVERLQTLILTIKNRALARLMKHVVGDRELMGRFKLAPAAKSIHHAYLGGLLEHSVSVAELARDISVHYADLDRDRLLTAAILHDIGKIREFSYDLVIDYSHEGRLLGHMVLGVQIVEEIIRGLKKFPAEEALLLKHMILSHHGQADLGAVRLPMTREAFVLHFADDLDAKMNHLGRIIGSHKDGAEAWTAYQPLYERFFFRGLPPSAEGSGPQEVEPGLELERGVQLSIWRGEQKKTGGS